MVNFAKSQPTPTSLANGSYNNGEVLNRLKDDFKNKCYLCEQKGLTNIQVEHFIPHQGNNALKYSWNNLFWACVHCNNIKLDLYNTTSENQLLNCINLEHDVVNSIHYQTSPFPKENFTFESCCSLVNQPNTIENTAQLLCKIYNGHTALKTIEALAIREATLQELRKLKKALYQYYSAQLPDNQKQIYFYKIQRLLSKESPFTAFKRWYVIEREAIREEFELYFD